MSEQAIVDPDIGYQLIPTEASDYATQVDHLYYGLLGLSALLIAILVGLIAVFGFRYHRSRTGARRPRIAGKAGHRIEIGFAAMLALFFMGLFYWGSHLYMDVYGDEPSDITINVIGKQWMWKVQHPDGTREINTLHVPVGESVTLRLTSQDVIHSFSIPALRLKRDAVPGFYTTARFTASQTGEFRLFCAEYCGNDHSRMRGRVVVMSRADYEDWLTRHGEGPSPAVAGKQLFQSHGCTGCHQDSAGAPAPALDGLYGRTVPLEGGDTIVADEAYIRDSILQPQKHVVAGFQPIMPSFSGQISESEIFQMIAYIKSLQPGDWHQDDASGATQ
ncbi:cytochrome c oxidase subunit II [Marinobacter fonticola]|uniref:cytochrome c oxidase subunit II n=1 Tax=Marinobacter fonticola TaxID=2603215 RepID=UPI0011E71B84|nr:cytochrome c oxidase subunit II [Marinobacter fonticola]